MAPRPAPPSTGGSLCPFGELGCSPCDLGNQDLAQPSASGPRSPQRSLTENRRWPPCRPGNCPVIGWPVALVAQCGWAMDLCNRAGVCVHSGPGTQRGTRALAAGHGTASNSTPTSPIPMATDGLRATCPGDSRGHTAREGQRWVQARLTTATTLPGTGTLCARCPVTGPARTPDQGTQAF